MRRSISLAYAAMVSSLIVAPATAHEPQPATRASGSASLVPQVRDAAAVVDGFHAALRRGDTAAAAALLADDALIYESGGVEQGKAEYALHHLAADADFSKLTRSVVTRRSGQMSGNLAWIATQSATTGSYRERPIDSVGTETMVLRRHGVSWRIVHIHWSSAKAK